MNTDQINTNKSILFFTMHRSGSMFIHGFLKQLCNIAKMTYYSPNLEINVIPPIPDDSFWDNKKGCFGPLRRFINVPNMNNYNIILHLRDPRDVLVSMFYSFCYSHKGEIEPNTGIRKEMADKGIDNFVLELSSGQPSISYYGTGYADLAGNVVKRYEDYISNLFERPNVIFVKYEQMVTDFQGWFNKIIVPFNLPPNPQVDENQVKENFSVTTEDRSNHKRKVIPGDYKEKLKTETIEQLNERFEPILKKLDYTI